MGGACGLLACFCRSVDWTVMFSFLIFFFRFFSVASVTAVRSNDINNGWVMIIQAQLALNQAAAAATLKSP